jgi:hypothetical protein
MSRLMDDLKRLNMTRKMEDPILVKEAVVEQKTVPETKKNKEIYVIGILVVVLVGFSAVSMALSLKTLSSLKNVEKVSETTSKEILLRLERSEAAMTAFSKDLKTQRGEWQASLESMAQQDKKALDQMAKMKAALKENKSDLEEITNTQDELKAYVQDSVAELKAADKAIKDKQSSLDGQVEKIIGTNEFLYNTY